MSRATEFELNPEKTLFYRVISTLLRVLAAVLFRPSVKGRENIPLHGPVLIAPTHRSNLDFAFSLFMSPRKVFFMAKDSLFKVPVLGTALLHLGAFPVQRGAADREAMRLAEEVLHQGHALIMFPEGTRKFGPTVEGLLDGAMFIAARTQAQVVPVAIGGTASVKPEGAKLPRLVKVRMLIGVPIAPAGREPRVVRSEVAAKTEELRATLESLYRESLSA